MKLLSIVTITKNDLEGLKTTLFSLRELKLEKWIENIVIDGGDHRNSLETKETCKNEKQTIYQSQKTGGISNGFNEGIIHSKGKWLWFLNGGDTILPEVSTSFLSQYLSQASSDIIVFDYIHGDKIIHKPPFYSLWPLYYNWIPHPSTIIRRDIFEKYEGFQSNYKVAMDGELWMRLFSLPDVTVDLVSLPIAKFDEGGISSTNLRLRSIESITILISYLPAIIRRSANKLFLFFKSLVENIYRVVR